ncbi:MAG: hypothetical protein HQK53_16875 [Oligoflexia bacterium]|nr:hypothetical protein [Oligoflexia bacterium]
MMPLAVCLRLSTKILKEYYQDKYLPIMLPGTTTLTIAQSGKRRAFDKVQAGSSLGVTWPIADSRARGMFVDHCPQLRTPCSVVFDQAGVVIAVLDDSVPVEKIGNYL